jgi:hypothetical protein
MFILYRYRYNFFPADMNLFVFRFFAAPRSSAYSGIGGLPCALIDVGFDDLVNHQ